jgi:hypothetical protein
MLLRAHIPLPPQKNTLRPCVSTLTFYWLVLRLGALPVPTHTTHVSSGQQAPTCNTLFPFPVSLCRGRRRAGLAYAITYSLSCCTKHFPTSGWSWCPPPTTTTITTHTHTHAHARTHAHPFHWLVVWLDAHSISTHTKHFL